MREMKDSGVEWIGEIPKDWGLNRAKATFRQRREKGNSEGILLAATQKNGMYPQDLVEGVVQVKEETDLQTFNSVHINDFVISLRSFQGGFEISSFEGVCSPAYQVFYNIVPIVHGYYKYLFKTDAFISKINSITVGIREGKNIQFSDFCDLLLPTLDINEQHRIADYLDAKCVQIDRAIARQQEAIEKLKEYKLSVITEAVTKGLNPDVPMKDSGIEWIGEIPEGWDLLKLRFAVENIGDIDHYMPASVDIGIPYVMTGDLHDLASAINFQECKMVSTEDYVELSSKISIKKGDLLFARYATIGTICYVDLDREFLVSYSCVIIKPNEDLMLGKFLYYVMKSNTFVEEVKQYTNSNTQGNVGIEALYRSKIVVPNVSLQEEIIGFLEEKCTLIDRSIDSKVGLVNKLEEYKKSLIYEVVTGKREV